MWVQWVDSQIFEASCQAFVYVLLNRLNKVARIHLEQVLGTGRLRCLSHLREMVVFA